MPLTKKSVNKMEMIAYPPHMGFPVAPAWEITLNDGKVYYYDTIYKRLCKVKKEIKWEKDSNGRRPFWRDMVSADDIFVSDEVNDKMIFYEEIKSKK
jgi:hypothetical protein